MQAEVNVTWHENSKGKLLVLKPKARSYYTTDISCINLLENSQNFWFLGDPEP